MQNIVQIMTESEVCLKRKEKSVIYRESTTVTSGGVAYSTLVRPGVSYADAARHTLTVQLCSI